MRKRNRGGALLLVLLLTLGGAWPAYAAEPETPQPAATEESGLCEHHPDHTAGCGYSEGTPCGYVCEICNPQDNGEPGAVTEETQPVPPSNALALTPEQVQALIDALPTWKNCRP